jgi:hypothetical protein
MLRFFDHVAQTRRMYDGREVDDRARHRRHCETTDRGAVLRQNVGDLMDERARDPALSTVRGDQRDPSTDNVRDAVQLGRSLVRYDGARSNGEPPDPAALQERGRHPWQVLDAGAVRGPVSRRKPALDVAVGHTPREQLPARERPALEQREPDGNVIAEMHVRTIT